MFVLQCLAVFTVAYALSALVAEVVFTCAEERALPAAVRAGLGLAFAVTYFAAAWLVVSVQIAWLLGSALLVLYGVAVHGPGAADDWRGRVRQTLRDHAKGYLACSGAVLLFFLPLAVALESGPFTEGGGDVSIYADSTKYLVDRGLTAYARPGSLANVLDNARDAAPVTLNANTLDLLALDRYLAADHGIINPPATDNAVYRLLTLRSMAPVLFAPYGLFSFLATSTNYHVYFGLQAFIYAVLLASGWYVFRAHGRAIALLYVALVAGSHGLIAVYYNMYSAQSISVAISAMTLAIVGRIRLLSWGGVRTYGITALYLFLSYVHFLSVTIPLLAITLLNRGSKSSSDAGHEAVASTAGPPRRALKFLVTAIVSVLVAFLVLCESYRPILLASNLYTRALSGRSNIYMGDHVAPFSAPWSSFVLGVVSQQHLEPFMSPPPAILDVIDAGIGFGACVLMLGLVLIARLLWRTTRAERGARSLAAAYLILLLTAAFHIALTQAYLYTQAKGAQDVLVVLYAALVLPLAAWSNRSRDRLTDRLAQALAVATVLFLATLVVVRGAYGYDLAREIARAAILDPSYFTEARRIRDEDPRAFVLFEPRKSADLYLSVQPFAAGRMVPTRHLAQTSLVFAGGSPQVRRVDAAALVRDEDIAHLWTLSARPGRGGPRWEAQRLSTLSTPTLLLCADDYERDFRRKPRGAKDADQGMFSYLRNGAGMLYLPAGGVHEVIVTLLPGDAAQHAALVRELERQLAKGELVGDLHDDGVTAQLTRKFDASDAPRIVTVARFSGESWLNVRLDGKDLVSNHSRAT